METDLYVEYKPKMDPKRVAEFIENYDRPTVVNSPSESEASFVNYEVNFSDTYFTVIDYQEQHLENALCIPNSSEKFDYHLAQQGTNQCLAGRLTKDIHGVEAHPVSISSRLNTMYNLPQSTLPNILSGPTSGSTPFLLNSTRENEMEERPLGMISSYSPENYQISKPKNSLQQNMPKNPVHPYAIKKIDGEKQREHEIRHRKKKLTRQIMIENEVHNLKLKIDEQNDKLDQILTALKNISPLLALNMSKHLHHHSPISILFQLYIQLIIHLYKVLTVCKLLSIHKFIKILIYRHIFHLQIIVHLFLLTQTTTSQIAMGIHYH
uniref:BZIP domain-containing protein n=1 Tax=Acrobeloides nanus TaxID=290746 RepID=A0A914CD36_9BILA